MLTKIVTRYQTNAQGRGQILAKANGRQRTVNFDPALSSDRNHGLAAGTLALALGLSWNDAATHETNDSGTVHTFTL